MINEQAEIEERDGIWDFLGGLAVGVICFSAAGALVYLAHVLLGVLW